MAMPATARRSEPHSTKFQADLGASISPLHTSRQAASSRASTPRPSISPLSTASKVAGSSPIGKRDTMGQEGNDEQETEVGNGVNGRSATFDDLDDDRSSSLSEPDEDAEEELQLNAITGNHQITANSVAHASFEVDSEAETERLEETPNRRRRRAASVEKTPSKLIQSELIDDDLSDPPSPLPVDPGGVSSAGVLPITSKKRKRSDDEESPLTSTNSELGQSPRKRSHELPSVEALAENDEDTKSAVEDSIEPISAPSPDLRDTITTPTRSGRDKRGKLKGRARKGFAKDQEADAETPTAVDEELVDDGVAKSMEELKHKLAASSLYQDLAKQFNAFRDKLYNERLANLTAELEMLNQPDCQHSDFLRQMSCVDARYAKQVRESQAFQKYKLQCLHRSTLAERSQIFSQYFQTAREFREDVMYKLSEDWYNLQKERRQSGQDRDEAYVYKFTNKKSEQIRQQAKYNQEVSVLSGFAKYVGFPAAPEISGLQGSALDDDLRNMKVVKRPPQASSHPHAINWALAQGKSDRLAHEQFIEQHAWARPQESMLLHATSNLTSPAAWAELSSQGPARTVIAPLNGTESAREGPSPYSTPMPHRRALAEHSSAGTIPANSDPVEPPSSVVAAPPTADRLQYSHLPPREPGSPLTVPKQRQNHTNDVPGWRNASNISSTSTIDAPASTEKPPPARAFSHPHSSLTQPELDSHARSSATPAPLRHPLFDPVAPPRKQQDMYSAPPGFRAQDGGFTPVPPTSAIGESS